jgi:hypothetical protein
MTRNACELKMQQDMHNGTLILLSNYRTPCIQASKVDFFPYQKGTRLIKKTEKRCFGYNSVTPNASTTKIRQESHGRVVNALPN